LARLAEHGVETAWLACAVGNNSAACHRPAPNTSGDAPMTRDTTDALLFDLGNVFFDLDFNLAVARWADGLRRGLHRICTGSLRKAAVI
jgi:hypothetical protein